MFTPAARATSPMRRPSCASIGGPPLHPVPWYRVKHPKVWSCRGLRSCPRGLARACCLLLPPLLHDAARGLPARLLLAAHELAVALAKVEAAEEVRLDLEDRSAALLRVEAVHAPARARCAVKLGEQD